MTWYVLYRDGDRNVMQPIEERENALERACCMLAAGHDVREVGPMRDVAEAIGAAELREIWQARSGTVLTHAE